MRYVSGLVARSALAVLALVSVVVAGQPASADPTDETFSYVALGDSYAAGVGSAVPDAQPPPCEQYDGGYPWVLAEQLGATDFEVLACSGDDLADVAVEQVPAVDPGADLVTVTVGANDVDFIQTVSICVLIPSRCQAAVDRAAAIVSSAEYRRAYVDSLLAVDAHLLLSGSDRARPVVAVTGYVSPYETGSDADTACLARDVVPVENHPTLNQAVTEINQLFAAYVAEAAQQATNADIRFVDVNDRFDDRRICSADPWINPIAFSGFFRVDRRSLHPTAVGYKKGYAAAIADAVGGSPGSDELPELDPDRNPALSAILECVTDNGDGTLTANFGYENREPDDYRIARGRQNRLVGSVIDTDGPVEDFVHPEVIDGRPGRTDPQDPAFTAVFPADQRVVWQLHGKTATASSRSARC